MTSQPGLITTITSPIPHGLIDSDIINITTVSDSTLNTILTSWPVSVLNPTQFTINFNSSASLNNFNITVLSLPRISL